MNKPFSEDDGDGGYENEVRMRPRWNPELSLFINTPGTT